MNIAIHQPEHLPWLGFIDKISKSDIYVIFDSVQYRRAYYQHRNRIRSNSPEGYSWLTVALKKQDYHTKIQDIEISYETDWITKYLNTISGNYTKAPFFEYYFENIKKILDKKYNKLTDLNLDIINFLFNEFGLKVEFVKSSELNIDDEIKGSDLILEICIKLNATKYISGSDGRNYMDLSKFKEKNIEVFFNDYQNRHAVYKQQYEPFLPYMSSIDLLMNYGAEKGREILFPKK